MARRRRAYPHVLKKAWSDKVLNANIVMAFHAVWGHPESVRRVIFFEARGTGCRFGPLPAAAAIMAGGPTAKRVIFFASSREKLLRGQKIFHGGIGEGPFEPDYTALERSIRAVA
jgi:hypothetical protein